MGWKDEDVVKVTKVDDGEDIEEENGEGIKWG